MIVYLENTQDKIVIPPDLENSIKQAMEIVARQEKLAEQTEVDITLVTDEEIHVLNRDYRQVDRPTDVLSFALDEGEDEPKVQGDQALHLLGDIIISAPRAQEQAEEYGHGLQREITYLAVHGVLHLLGYDHMTAADKKVMRKREEEVLREMTLSEEFLAGHVDEELWQAALQARWHAYNPYSHFAVGAAVRTGDGKIFTGCNVENASYGLTICAERNAVFAAVCAGYQELTALCVVADTPEPVAPCGACRQVIAEFKVPKIILANCAGKIKVMTGEELLPYSFKLEK